MQVKATIEQARSPVPGVIPEPVRVEYEDATTQPARGRRRLSRARARMLSALHGDKYMLPTTPPSWAPAPPATRRRDAS
jgi:hypothetical protein